MMFLPPILSQNPTEINRTILHAVRASSALSTALRIPPCFFEGNQQFCSRRGVGIIVLRGSDRKVLSSIPIKARLIFARKNIQNLKCYDAVVNSLV